MELLEQLRAFNLFIFDLDGVVYRGMEVIQGAPETISALRTDGKKVAFNTNNSTKTRIQFKEKLQKMDISINLGEIFNLNITITDQFTL